MNIYDYLKMDHEHVAHMFKQFSKSKLPERRAEIANMIAFELTAHAEAEQATFYKTLEQYAESRDEALHGVKEHQEIEDQIAAIVNAKEYGSAFIKKVEKLQKLVEHHVHEEEHNVFKKAKKVLSDYEAYVIKEQMHYLKEQLKRSMEKSTA